MDKIKVLLVDNHALFAEGMRQLLMTGEDIECVAIAADGEEAIRLTGKLHPMLS